MDSEYTVEFRIITDHGKFEGEAWYAPKVYQWYLDGDPGEIFGDTNVYVLSEDDRRAFELSDHVYALVLEESDQGFVFVNTLDKSEYEQLVEEDVWGE